MLAEGDREGAHRECLAAKRRIEDTQREELAAVCTRCAQCRTCAGAAPTPHEELDSSEELRGGGLGGVVGGGYRGRVSELPFLEPTELHEEGEWRGRTCVRPDSNHSDAALFVEIDEEEDGGGGAVTITVHVANYDFDQLGGYAVLLDVTRGAEQLAAAQAPSFEVRLAGGGGGVVALACLVGGDDRPLGVCQTALRADGVSPAIKSARGATRISTPKKAPGDIVTGFPVLVAAPGVRAPEGRRVSLVMTACVAMDGRLTLLEETVLSFMRSNTYPIDRYILIDDSGDERVHEQLLDLYGDTFDVLLNVVPRTGQMYSIDAAYALVSSDYVFHCQDDWLFHTRGNFVRDSIALLEDKPEVLVAWCRDHRDHDLPLGGVEVSPSGVPYRLVLPMGRWKGFTFNPGLRRMRDYMAMRPAQRFWYENHVQAYMRWMGMFGVSLVDGWVRHTGDHFSTKPSYQYANEQLARAQQAARQAG